MGSSEQARSLHEGLSKVLAGADPTTEVDLIRALEVALVNLAEKI